ncbi:MAG: thiamine phosphate synthase [Candidatus Longimicrobiales bacterium M2_2A_002]
MTDAGAAAPRAVDQVVAEALEAGAPAIQLRDKNATPAELYQEALELVDLTRTFGARLFINDRLDVALAAGADGVHLGPDDLPIPAARAAASAAGRPEILIGASTDRPETARQLAADGADYIGCGAVSGTPSKEGLEDERIGPEGLRAVVEAVDVPVVGIGGVDTGNVADIARTGAVGAAVIRAVMSADDIGAAVKALLDAFR